MSWSRKDPHLLVRCCPHPRASSAIALLLFLDKTKRICLNAYKILVEERLRVNSAFGRTTIDPQAVETLPENGVPEQLIECGVQMREVDNYAATRCGPGTMRDPLDATREDDDASDEISDAFTNDGHTEDVAK